MAVLRTAVEQMSAARKASFPAGAHPLPVLTLRVKTNGTVGWDNDTHYYKKARFELKSRKVRSIPDRAIGSIAEGAGGGV